MDPIFFSNIIVRPKKYSYDAWWNAPVESVSDKSWSSKYGPVTHGQYVKDFYYSLRSTLNNTGYTITNEKEFKNKIATLIYRLSDDHL